MKEFQLSDLTQKINNNKSKAEKTILESKSKDRVIRTRSRDSDEVEILDKLCMEKWKKSVKEGKIKYLSKREWYYDPS